MIDATNFILTVIMSSVIQSDVIIVHKEICAVAVEYDKELMDYPMVTAKGIGIFANWIRIAANLAKITVFQRKKLSMDLFHTVRIYNEIDKRFQYRVALLYYKIIYKGNNHKLISLLPPESDIQ